MQLSWRDGWHGSGESWLATSDRDFRVHWNNRCVGDMRGDEPHLQFFNR